MQRFVLRIEVEHGCCSTKPTFLPEPSPSVGGCQTLWKGLEETVNGRLGFTLEIVRRRTKMAWVPASALANESRAAKPHAL